MARFKQYGHGRSTQGFTLVELLVVMAIVGLLAGLSIAGVASFTSFATSALQRSTRDVFNLLKSARIYSSTHSVKTAVVYHMGEPIADSITGIVVREIVAAAIMYEYPAGGQAVHTGKYIGIPGEYGEFQLMEDGTGIALWNPTDDPPIDNFYSEIGEYIALPDDVNCFSRVGLAIINMKPILSYVAGQGPSAAPDDFGNYFADPVPFLAHVFQPSGRIEATPPGVNCPVATTERFKVYIVPSADEPLSARLINTDGNREPGNIIYRSVSLYRSTGRVEIDE